MSSLNIKKNVVMAAVEVAATTVTLFVLYRFMLTHLGLSDLGVWAIVSSAASAVRLGDMGVTAGMGRFVALHKAKGDDARAARLVETALTTVTVFYVLISALLYFPALWVLAWLLKGHDLAVARSLLPYILVSLVLANMSGVALVSLAGVQRSFVRSLVTIAGSVVLLIIAIALIPRIGLLGTVIAQIIQAVFLLVSAWISLIPSIRGLSKIPLRWSWSELKPLLSYGAQLQVSNIAVLLFEPATKLILARYGGTSAVGLYEIASRLIGQSRSLIVAVNQTLVATFAHLHEKSRSDLLTAFRKSSRLNSLAVVVWLMGMTVVVPVVSYLMLGRLDTDLLWQAGLLSVGGGLNTLMGPTYVLGLGMGRVRDNVISHVVITAINPVAAITLGQLFGDKGVVAGASIALAAGAAVLMHSHIKLTHSLSERHSSG